MVGEDGYDLWLRYRIVDDSAKLRHYHQMITHGVVRGTSETAGAIRDEFKTGLKGLLGTNIAVTGSPQGDGAIIVGTPDSSPPIAAVGWSRMLEALGPEGYLIRSMTVKGKQALVIASISERGALYGTFHFLRLIQTHQPLSHTNIARVPEIKYRLLNHWDNLQPDQLGSVERGYAGGSLWKWEQLPGTLDPRYRDYARANASIGINGTVLNNVNADPSMLRGAYLQKAAALADVFRPYGMRVFLAANFAAPLYPSATPHEFKGWGGIGNLSTADPFDQEVVRWWEEKIEEIYSYIPDFGGFLVKADAEGMPGPAAYGRTPADGANLLAELLRPHGGVVMWRAFVYDPAVDPDRAKRAYTTFAPLDGEFQSNVFVQVKNGPLDFQPREPFHPLFGAMPNTPLMMEFQITQEYLGHATHLIYLAPMWKEILDADTYANEQGTPVAQVIDGSAHNHAMTGIAGVANTGSDPNWCGHHFAQANWYAFGRLAWDPGLSAGEIAEEWARMTWGNDPTLLGTIESMLAGSWRAYVNYTAPLGLNFTMDNELHYDPDPTSHDGNEWMANAEGLGYDRTSRGTDAVSQYPGPLRQAWDDLSTCPEDYLLWFHFVNWDHRMSSGRTLWEELCYRYEQGVQYVSGMRSAWQALENLVDHRRFIEVRDKLVEQERHAKYWRDKYLEYFQNKSKRPIPPPT